MQRNSKDSQKTVQAPRGDKGKGKNGAGKEHWKSIQNYVHVLHVDQRKDREGGKQSSKTNQAPKEETKKDEPKIEILDVQVYGKLIKPNSWKPTDQRFSGLYQSLTEIGTAESEKKSKKRRLDKPQLVVSVIGDVVDGKPDKLQKGFQDGIETLLKTQGLWLMIRMPCRTHNHEDRDAALAKLVFKAVERLNPKEKGSAVVIGVGTKCNICNNDEHPIKAEQSTSDGKTSQSENSDSNVENAGEKLKTEGPDSKPRDMYDSSILLYGANDQSVAEFIAEFQSYICSKTGPQLTSVSLLFGGKHLMNAWPVFKKGIPVVIVEESGGVADYISLCVSSGDVSKMETIDVHRFNEEDATTFLEAKSTTKRWKELVNFCVLDGEPIGRETKGLKAAVLKAAIDWHDEIKRVIQRNDSNPWSQKIDLSLSLDESQMAKTHIFDKEYQRRGKKQSISEGDDDKKKRLKDALLNNQPKFVKLFLEAKYHYCNLHEFCEGDVHDLYNEMLGPEAKTDEAITSIIKGLIKEDWSKIGKSGKKGGQVNASHESRAKFREIGKVISQLVGPHYELTGVYSTYNEEDCCSCRCKSQKKKVDEKLNIDIEIHLFLWAVLFNRVDIAFFFWQHWSNDKYDQDEKHASKHPHIIMALMASTILSNLAQKAEDGKEPALQELLAKHAKLFEVRASDVLMECSLSDRHKTQNLLIREHAKSVWGEGTTLLSAAFTGKRRYFLERMPCQVKLAAVWRGKMVWSTPTWKIFLTTIIPFLIFIIKFTEKETAVEVLRKMLGCESPKVDDEENDEENDA